MCRRLAPATLAAWAGTLVAAGPAHADPTLPGQLTNDLFEAEQCALCHTFPNAMGQDADPLYAPFYGWQGSMMANAARDPVFWAGVAIADQDAPGETSECVRCHSPRAFLEGRGDATSIDDLLPQDFDGVTCELCHRMTDQGALGNAQYAVDDIPGPNGLVPRHGPWDYPGGVGSPGSPPHDFTADPFTASAELCGTCHDVTTPRERVDDAGTPMGMQFNEQRTYSEWAGSVFAQAGPDAATCQDCHMPAVVDVPGCQQHVDMYSHRTGGRRHDLVGANRFMVEALRSVYGNDGTGDINDFFFDNSIDQMDALLATAATLEVEAPPEVHLGEGLDGLVATVTNDTGHKLPSGYSEGRVMWIEVTARYGEQLVWSSGLWMPGVGPEQDLQLRTYQGVADDYDTGTTLHLLLNNHWVEDTRIPPRGLTPNVETDPVGDRYVLQGDGTWPHFDTTTYAFEGVSDVVDATPEDASDDVLDVQVRLLYLINTPQYIEFLADENTTNEAGSEVAMLFDTLGGAPPLVLAEQAITVPIVGFGEPPASTTGTVDSSGEPPGGTSAAGTTGTSGAGTAGTATETDGSPAGDDGGGGCSCRAGADDRGAWLWWGLPLGFAVRRRARAARAR